MARLEMSLEAETPSFALAPEGPVPPVSGHHELEERVEGPGSPVV